MTRIAQLLAGSALMMAEGVAESTSTTAAPATDSKPKTVIENMDSRRMFDTTEEAANYLNKCADDFADFDSHPQVIHGIDGDGNFDPEVYTPDMRVMVAVLANRGEKGKPSTVKAIVVTPAPKMEAILESETGRAWANKILDKELNHVAVRALRTADDVDTVADQMPLTLADYVTSSRESSGGIMETFNELYKALIATLASRSAPFAKARLTKGEFKKGLESRSYALEYYSKLEDRGTKPSLFVMAAQLGQREAKEQGLDPAIFDKWLATRDEKAFSAATADESEEDFDLDSLVLVTDENKSDEATPDDATPSADDSTTQPNNS